MKPTKLAKLSVKNVITIGGRMANNGNVHRRSKNWQKFELSGLVRCELPVPINSASKLFRNVIAMIGKLADNVKTEKNKFDSIEVNSLNYYYSILRNLEIHTWK